jgi:hypothetical protein
MTSPVVIRQTIAILRRRLAEVDRTIEKIQRESLHQVSKATRDKPLV